TIPWVELVEADALTYVPGEPVDAVHCRIVLIHQPTPQEFLAHMVALTRHGGPVAVQDFDADVPTGEPTVLCHPPSPPSSAWAPPTLSRRCAGAPNPKPDASCSTTSGSLAWPSFEPKSWPRSCRSPTRGRQRCLTCSPG